MKKTRFTAAQIVKAIKQHESSSKVSDIGCYLGQIVRGLGNLVLPKASTLRLTQDVRALFLGSPVLNIWCKPFSEFRHKNLEYAKRHLL